jgi:hypothetical protein
VISKKKKFPIVKLYSYEAGKKLPLFTMSNPGPIKYQNIIAYIDLKGKLQVLLNSKKSLSSLKKDTMSELDFKSKFTK